jgi:Histidine kinase-, DNA gyrase B-, and HSP90-like ATPase
MPTSSNAKLTRETFSTSRLLEFCSRKELINQTGHGVEEWPLVILKELIDNALDACEDAEVAPHITVTVRSGHIVVADNGPGIGTDVVQKILDYNVRVSSREAYVSPTRGAQGNALKTVLAMPFALNGTRGETLIEARCVAHRITFAVDHVRQEPKIEHAQEASIVRNGTQITAPWPVSARSKPDDVKQGFLQIAQGFGWLNPHLMLEVDWEGEPPPTSSSTSSKRNSKSTASIKSCRTRNGWQRLSSFLSRARAFSTSSTLRCRTTIARRSRFLPICRRRYELISRSTRKNPGKSPSKRSLSARLLVSNNAPIGTLLPRIPSSATQLWRSRHDATG